MAEPRLYTPDEVEALEKRIRELEGAIGKTWKEYDVDYDRMRTDYYWCSFCFEELFIYVSGVSKVRHKKDCIVRTLEGEG